MLKSLFAALLLSTAFAQTGSIKSAATLGTEVNTFFLDNGTGQIIPFNARQALLDIVSSYANKIDGATGVPFTPTGGISSTNVQAMGAELDTKKAASSAISTVGFSGAATDLITNQTSWTPTLTFQTPGDVAVAYTFRIGRYVQVSTNLVLVQVNIVTSSFTFTTASGNLQITGFPLVTQNTAGLLMRGTVQFGGINKVGYSQLNLGVGANSSTFQLNASGMNVAAGAVAATDTTSGTNITINAEVFIFL